MTKQMGKNSGIPKYIQLKNTLLQRMREGQSKPGDKLLTERELMKEFGLSSATVSHAMREMAGEGFIVRKVGGGTFVTGASPAQGGSKLNSEITLLINDFPKTILQEYDRLNWFIMSEIRRGVTNTFNGKTKTLSEFEFFKELELPENRKAIVINPSVSEIRKLNEKKNIDYIFINQDNVCDSEYNCVNWEQMHGVYEAMTYLIRKLGHKHIAIISRGTESHKDRYAAYRLSLEIYDIPFREDFVVNADGGTENDGYKAMKKLLELEIRPTAVFVVTDIKAVGAVKAIRDSGLRMPEDISVIGFDDIPGIEELCPLTTVKAPYYEMGEMAVKLLYAKISEKKDKIPSVTARTSLMIRKSCSPAPVSKNQKV